MRAPEVSDLANILQCEAATDGPFYRDPDLKMEEASPGYLSGDSVQRAIDSMGLDHCKREDIAQALGRFATLPKDSLMPDLATSKDVETVIQTLDSGGKLLVHGMALIAFDDRNLFVNGSSSVLPTDAIDLIMEICRERSLSRPVEANSGQVEMLMWMLLHGAFELPVNC
jgi:hypothetical protein